MKQETLGIIKPSCTPYVREVEAAIIAAGLSIKKSAVVQFSKAQAEEFYSEHKGKPFFSKLVDMLTSAHVIVYSLYGENAINVWRDLIGPTNPNDENARPDQLRNRFADGAAYAAGSPDNGFHGSANKPDAKAELLRMKLWGIW